MAARTITQRIALDGGNEIRSQLEKIGTAAVAAFDKLAGAGAANTALKSVGTSIEGVAKSVRQLQDSAGRVGDSFSKLGSAGGNVVRNVGLISAAVVGAAAAFAKLTSDAGDAQENLDNESAAVGLSTERYDRLKKAADLSGVGELNFKALQKINKAIGESGKSSDDFAKKTQKLNSDFNAGRLSAAAYNEALSDLSKEASDSGGAFAKLGINLRGLDAEQALYQIGSALKALPDGAEKAALQLEIFGTKSSKYGAFAAQGADGINKLTLAVDRLTPTLDEGGRKALDRASDSFKTLREASKTTSTAILAVFANDASRIVEAYTEKIVGARAAWVEFAKTVEAKVRPVVDDIVALLEGRDADVKNGFILKARDAVLQFGADVKDAITNIIVPAFVGLLSILDTVAQAINKVFGTKLTGGQIAIAAVVLKLTGTFGLLVAGVRSVISVFGFLVTSWSTLASAAPVLLRIILAIAGSFATVPVAVAAVGLAIGFLVGAIIQKLGGISGIIKSVQGWFSSLSSYVSGIASSIGSFFSDTWSKIKQGASDLVTGIVGFFASLPSRLGAFLEGLGAVAQGIWDGIKEGVGALWQYVSDGFAALVQSVVDFFAGLPAALGTIFTGLIETFAGWWQSIKNFASSAVDSVVGYFKSGVDAIYGFFTALLDKAKSIFASIAEGAAAVARAIRGAAGGGGGDNVPGRAGGGPIYGPGNGTSDSILARLSNGEFVQRTAAVRKYGLAFMHALNQGRISAGRVRDLMSGVDFSGLTTRVATSLTQGMAVPRYAGGGLVPQLAAGPSAQMRPVNVTIGGQTYQMQAPPDVAARLERDATAQQMRSAGRKPSWFR